MKKILFSFAILSIVMCSALCGSVYSSSSSNEPPTNKEIQHTEDFLLEIIEIRQLSKDEPAVRETVDTLPITNITTIDDIINFQATFKALEESERDVNMRTKLNGEVFNRLWYSADEVAMQKNELLAQKLAGILEIEMAKGTDITPEIIDQLKEVFPCIKLIPEFTKDLRLIKLIASQFSLFPPQELDVLKRKAKEDGALQKAVIVWSRGSTQTPEEKHPKERKPVMTTATFVLPESIVGKGPLADKLRGRLLITCAHSIDLEHVRSLNGQLRADEAGNLDYLVGPSKEAYTLLSDYGTTDNVLSGNCNLRACFTEGATTTTDDVMNGGRFDDSKGVLVETIIGLPHGADLVLLVLKDALPGAVETQLGAVLDEEIGRLPLYGWTAPLKKDVTFYGLGTGWEESTKGENEEKTPNYKGILPLTNEAGIVRNDIARQASGSEVLKGRYVEKIIFQNVSPDEKTTGWQWCKDLGNDSAKTTSGDSGSAVIVNGKIIGIISSGSDLRAEGPALKLAGLEYLRQELIKAYPNTGK